MKKYVMNGKAPLLVFFEEGLRNFSPGEVVEADQAPHEWFELVNPPKPKPKAKPAAKVTPKIHISKERIITKKDPLPKVDLPTDKF
jgi:hypothetical protein